MSSITGVSLSCSDNIHVIDCDIHDNLYAVEFYHSTNNSISSSTIHNNSIGVRIRDDAVGNRVFHNNFVNNDLSGFDECFGNWWDNDYPSGGNYWDNYSGHDEDGDGIGDNPHPIPGGDKEDRYPLMQPFGEDDEPPLVNINKPKEGYLYLLNYEVIPFFTTLVIGRIDVCVDAIDYIYGMDRVEFYLDGELVYSDDQKPFCWQWYEFDFSRRTLRTIAYDISENSAEDIITVWKFF